MTRILAAMLLVPALFAASPASSAPSSVRADGDDFSFNNPRYDKAATLAVEGTLETTVIDSFGDHGSAEFDYGVRTADGDLIPVPDSFGEKAPNGGDFEGELVLAGAVAADIRAEDVPVTQGKAIDADSAAGETAVDVASAQETPLPVAEATVEEPVAAAATPSAHHLYVAVMSNNATTLPAGALNQMKNYWITEGAVSTFDTAQSVTYHSNIATASNCGLSGDHQLIWSEADGLFPGVSFDSGSGNHLMVVVADSCLGSAGVGTVGTTIADGGRSVVSASPSGAVQIGAHELGHNLGLGHANLESCTSPVTCSLASYYDVYSVMGFAITATGGSAYDPPALGSAFRRFLGLNDQVDNVTGTGATTVELEPRAASSGRRGLRVVDPGSSLEYFIEYRSGTDRDEHSFYPTGSSLGGPYRYGPGVTITQYTTQSPGQQTKLLTRRMDADATDRGSLAEGETFSGAGGRVQVTVNSIDGASGASVTVKRPATSEVVSPSADPTVSVLVPSVGSTVTAQPGVWADGTTFAYQWRINGSPIPGATGPTYAIPGAYFNSNLSVTVTGSKPGFLNNQHTSPAVLVAAGNLSGTRPRIIGTRKVGKTLRISAGYWTPGTTLVYRWYANGKFISKATKSSYKITKGKRKKRITARVWGVQYGYSTIYFTSARTGKIK